MTDTTDYLIRHLKHTGEVTCEFEPENLQFSMVENSPETISYEVTLPNPVVFHDFVGPYRTDWELLKNGVKFLGGMHTGVSGKMEEDFVTVTGKGWLHYLDLRMYPYDPSFTRTFFLNLLNVDTEEIVRRLLTDTRDIDTYSLDYTMVLQPTGYLVPIWQLQPGDTTSILQLVTNLSQQNFGEGSFDFYMDKNKVFRMFAPAFVNPPGTVEYVFTDVDVSNLLDWEFSNIGPKATHVRAQGQGTSISWPEKLRHYPLNSSVYRRIDIAESINNINDPAMVEKMASRLLSESAYPVHELSIKIDPNNITGFWDIFNRPGMYMLFDNINLNYHVVGGIYKVVQMDIEKDNENNEACTFHLNPWNYISEGGGHADI